jgi:hypothetical protein
MPRFIGGSEGQLAQITANYIRIINGANLMRDFPIQNKKTAIKGRSGIFLPKNTKNGLPCPKFPLLPAPEN